MKHIDKFRWPPLETLRADISLPPEYKYRALSEAEIPELCKLILEWYPDISVGAGKSYITPDFYHQEVSFLEQDEKQTIVYVGRFDDRVISALFFQINPASKTMYSRFAVGAPDHRGSGASLFAVWVMDALAEKLELAMNYSYVTLKNQGMQKLMERAGFKPVGVVPFSDIELDANRQQRHIVEALYVKTYLPPELLQRIDPQNLTPLMQKVWQSISEHTGIFPEQKLYQD